MTQVHIPGTPHSPIDFEQTVNWLFVDLNSYFASVEQQIHPHLRGRPVAVIPTLTDFTSCIAASYEANAFGVKTGTLVKDAKKMCPGIQFISGNHRLYVEYHNRIVEAVENCHPISAVMSIDEVACELRGSDRKLSNALQLAHEVKQSILKVGEMLKSSVGLGPNRFLSKVASDMQKPDGLTVITLQDLPYKLLKLKLQDFPGIGLRMHERLLRYGVRDTKTLLSLDIKHMREIWGGIGGEYFYRWLRGENFYIEYERNKSVGHSHVLPPALRNEKGSYAVAQKLLFKAGYRLRKLNKWARRMSLSVRFLDKTKWRAEIKFSECQDDFSFNEILKILWQKKPVKAPLKVSITLWDLISLEERNFSFFEDPHRRKLSLALDKINSRYGRYTIYLGGIHEVLSSAPTRIAFTQIPDTDI